MMIRPMHIDEIGGAKARQSFFTAGRQVMRGEEIPLEQLRQWPTANRNVMIEKGYIEVWPKSVTFLRAPAAIERDDEPDANTQRIIVPRGFGRYDVIEGVVLAQNITKDEAHAIAGTPKPIVSELAPIARTAQQLEAPKQAGKRGGSGAGRPRMRDQPEPKMPSGVKPRDPSDEPNGPIEG